MDRGAHHGVLHGTDAQGEQRAADGQHAQVERVALLRLQQVPAVREGGTRDDLQIACNWTNKDQSLFSDAAGTGCVYGLGRSPQLAVDAGGWLWVSSKD